jgi:hypothetical protein
MTNTIEAAKWRAKWQDTAIQIKRCNCCRHDQEMEDEIRRCRDERSPLDLDDIIRFYGAVKKDANGEIKFPVEAPGCYASKKEKQEHAMAGVNYGNSRACADNELAFFTNSLTHLDELESYDGELLDMKEMILLESNGQGWRKFLVRVKYSPSTKLDPEMRLNLAIQAGATFDEEIEKAFLWILGAPNPWTFENGLDYSYVLVKLTSHYNIHPK